MCGIAVLISKKANGFKDDFIKSCKVISHRGPDDSGMVTFDDCLIGFRRLSIIDLSVNGHQPMTDSEARYWIVFNGEIYNHNELKTELEKDGFTFKSKSDTEVILNGYKKYGKSIVEKLDGMFSFVVYDKLTGNIFAARDRMGKKPLLYYYDEKVLVLFSELKQIIQFSFFYKKINVQALSLFLEYGAVPSPLTIFENVQQIQAGHYAVYEKDVFSISEYWRPQIKVNRTLVYQDAVDRVHDFVKRSVTKRLISDVPLGAFLSGGIDSSIITAIMANHSKEVKTFSVNYADAPSDYDESLYANLIVEKYQTKHTSITVSPEDIINNLEKIIWHMDQPSCDAINTYFVSQSARQGVTVSLSGVGGDELFAGYSTFKFSNLLSKFRQPTSGNHESLMNRLFEKLPVNFQMNWKIRLITGILGAFPTNFSRYNLVKQIYKKNEIKLLLCNENFVVQNSIEKFFNNSMSDIQQITMAEVNGYLVNTLLRDSDVMGMAHSLEIRCPFIDHQLIEFALTLPDNYKIQNFDSKIILKDAFRKYLPDEILHRKKMGFAFPLSVWLKKSELKELVEDCLSDTSILKRGIFDLKTVKKIKSNYFSLKNTSVQTYQSYQKVWELMVFELWMRQFLDK